MRLGSKRKAIFWTGLGMREWAAMVDGATITARVETPDEIYDVRLWLDRDPVTNWRVESRSAGLEAGGH